MPPGARAGSSIVSEVCCGAEHVHSDCLITDCAACKQDTLSLHLIYGPYKYFHGNHRLDRFHLERKSGSCK